MAHYCLYIPNCQGAKDDHLDRVGLGGLVGDDSGAEWADVLRAPPELGGGRGMLCSWRGGNAETDPHMSVHPDHVWVPAKPDEARGLEAGRFYFGHEPNRPVTPTDLARRKQFAGHWRQLADGQNWVIPVASKLPHRHGLNGQTGRFQRCVHPKYQAFYNRCDGYAAHIFEELDAMDILKERRPELSLIHI